MALIIDPDDLNDATEIVITPASKTVQLVVAGNLSTDGVTIKCVYSKLKELWKSDDTYIKYPFPMTPITDEQFEMVNDWDWADDTTRYLLRTGGWAVKNASGISTAEWAGVIGLGSLGATDQVYFQQGDPTSAGSAATNFQLEGQVNQAICVYTSGGNDYRSYLKLFCREWGKSFATSQLSDIGVDTLTYQAYRFPLTNASDPKITDEMSAMSASPFTDITIEWSAAATGVSIGGVTYYFHVVIDGSDEDLEDIYQSVQYQLMQDLDIDIGAGIQVGKTSPTLLRFVGDTLYTIAYTNTPTGGTYVANFQNDDINRIIFVDDDLTERQYPYTAVLTINFGDNLINDSDSKYWVFFTDIPSGDYGDSDAILIEDADTLAMSGLVSGQSSVQRTFAYDTNSQGGRTSGTDAPYTAVAIGLSAAQFVKTTGTILRSTSNSVSLVSALERNYQNPA